MGEDAERPLIATSQYMVLNLGCGFKKLIGAVNVDAYEICEPDVVWDLEKTPWPWKDNTVEKILAWHVFEHLKDWLPSFWECARVLKPGGTLSIRVPDATNTHALAFRDHYHIFDSFSFTDCLEKEFRGFNAWAKTQPVIPMQLIARYRIPFDRYLWIPKRILWWLANHCVNFMYEQEFVFRKG